MRPRLYDRNVVIFRAIRVNIRVFPVSSLYDLINRVYPFPSFWIVPSGNSLFDGAMLGMLCANFSSLRKLMKIKISLFVCGIVRGKMHREN